MQAIRTSYKCPTNCSGARIQAKTQAGAKYYPYDHSINIDENHENAAKRYARELKWNYLYVGAQFDNDWYRTPISKLPLGPEAIDSWDAADRISVQFLPKDGAR